MIKLQDYTPEVYYRESRDFQFIGRLYDLVLNYVKTNADLIYSLPLSDNSDNQFIDLMAMTLGFHAKHKYTSQQLKAICFVLSEIIRNKGTIKALTIACDAIFHAEGIQGQFEYELPDKDNNTNIIIYLPQELSDTTLLNDLFEYILPAGMSCQIIKTYSEKALPTTEVGVESTFYQYKGAPGDPADPDKKGFYDNNLFAKIAILGNGDTNLSTGTLNVNDAKEVSNKDLPGKIANTNVYIPEARNKEGE